MKTRYLARAVLALLLVGLMIVPPAAQAAAPSNDDIGSATVITSLPYNADKSIVLDTTEATTASDPASCAYQMGHTVWYSFTPTAKMSIVADTFGSSYDTVLAVYTSSRRGVLTQVVCNDDTQSLQSQVIFQAAVRTTYWFMVGAYGSSPGGSLTFSVSEQAPPPPPPANDNIGSATVISSLPYNADKSIVLDTAGATTAASDPASCAYQMGYTVWYSFRPTANTSIVADTFDSNYDTVLAVYMGTSHSLTPVACNDEADGSQSQVGFNAVAGTTYWFMVGAYDSYPGGSLIFSVSEQAPPPAPPSNDDRAGATVITSLPYNADKSIALDTTGATTGASDPATCAFPNASVWYSFTPATNMGLVADTHGSNYDTVLGVYTSSRRGALTPVVCSGDQVYFNAVAGTTYWIMVGAQRLPGSLVFSLAQAPVTIDLTINSTGSLDPATGIVTLSGTATCSAPVTLYLNGYVEQQARNGVIGGELNFAVTPISCNGVTPWTATASAYSGTFSAGKATAYVAAWEQTYGLQLDQTATVSLRAAKR